MNNTIVKTEITDDNECSMNSNDGSLPDLTDLLNEVKKEEPKALSDEETENPNTRGETLPESFFDDLYREELEADSPEATTDVDIQKLQEIIANKKKILKEVAGTSSRKRKDQNDLRACNDNQENASQAKRSRQATDAHEDNHGTGNKSPVRETPPDGNNSNQQKDPTTNNDGPIAAEEPNDPELEFENLFKTETFNTPDEDQTISNQMTLAHNMQAAYQFPNAMPMQAMYNPTANQMMGNMALGGFPMMYNNMGYPPGFYPPNMMNMQMMGCGIPQMNVLSNSNEVECLPVVSKFPTFKPIKLEKKSSDSNEENQGDSLSADERKRKVLQGCIHLLNKMKNSEPTGKFAYTSTVTKVNTATDSNSILLKITNVNYNFQSIGPKLNIQDWGLREIPNNNVEIAKQISLSADMYFNKIEQSTMVKKLIKTEKSNVDNQAEAQMEEEEPSLSTYLKNTMTQTEAIVCGECVARKRKGMHEIAVQATVYTGSIGCQTTDSNFKFYEILMEGMSENQMKAMYEFSKLIQQPLSGDIMKLREDLIKAYNLSQEDNEIPVPSVDNSSIRQNTNINPRVDPRSKSDPRRYPSPGLKIQSVQSLAQDNSSYSQQRPPGQFSGNTRNNQQGRPQDRPIPNQQMPPGQVPGLAKNAHQYQNRPQDQGRQQNRPMQIPNQQMPPGQIPGTRNDLQYFNRPPPQIPAMQRHHGHTGQAPRFPGHPVPEFPSQQFPGGSQQEPRKNYGRGGLRR